VSVNVLSTPASALGAVPPHRNSAVDAPHRNTVAPTTTQTPLAVSEKMLVDRLKLVVSLARDIQDGGGAAVVTGGDASHNAAAAVADRTVCETTVSVTEQLQALKAEFVADANLSNADLCRFASQSIQYDL
jgi:hypothetical protein